MTRFRESLSLTGLTENSESPQGSGERWFEVINRCLGDNYVRVYSF